MDKVGLIMGSKSDFDIVSESIKILNYFGINFDVTVSSAHRTPLRTSSWSKNAVDKGYRAIIAFAGASAHLAGVVAAESTVPVIAVPISSTSLLGLDALLSMVQMPGGIPVAVMSIGKAGAINAALFACQIIAVNDPSLQSKLLEYRKNMIKKVEVDDESVQEMVNNLMIKK